VDKSHGHGFGNVAEIGVVEGSQRSPIARGQSCEQRKCQAYHSLNRSY
jgi:hypothetical protein